MCFPKKKKNKFNNYDMENTNINFYTLNTIEIRKQHLLSAMIEVLEKDHRIHIYILFKKNLLSAH